METKIPNSCAKSTISIKDINGETITIPLKYVQRNNAKPETMLYNTTKNINLNDISNINYTAEATNNHKLKPLSERFCDNIILFYKVPIIEQDKIEYLSKFLAEYTYKIRRILLSHNINVSKRCIKPTYSEKEENYYKEYIKVALPNAPIDNIFALITDENIIKSFNDEGIYIHDIDFTQDFAGVINKDEVVQYLIENEDYVMEGNTINGNYVIMDNDKLVGKNCLTFLHNTEHGRVRYKFYNKFVQSIESPSVRGKIGSHIADWLHNPDEQLRNSIKNSLDTGLLRLEITFYIDNKVVSKEYIHKHLNYLAELLPEKYIYHNSISNQWKAVLNKLKYNLLVIDLDNYIALFSYFVNVITGKVNGFYIYNITDNYINNVLKLFSYNLPLLILVCRRNGEELIIKGQCYEKVLVPNITKKFVLSELATYLTNGNKRFAPVYKLDNFNTNNLEDTSIAKFRITSAKNISILKTENIPISFINSTLSFSLYKMRKSLEQQYKEELEREKVFMDNYDDIIKSVKTDNDKIDKVAQDINKESAKLQEEVQEAKQQCMRLRNYLITELLKPKTYYSKLLDMEDNVKMYVYGFRDISTKHKTIYLLALSPDNKLTTSTPLKLYPTDKEIKDFIYNSGEMEGLEDEWYKLDETNKISGRDTGKWCFIIEKHGAAYKKTKNLQPVMEVIDAFGSFRKEDRSDDEVYEISKVDLETSISSMKEYNDEFFKHKYINSNNLPKIDEIVKQGDVVEVLDCYRWKCTNLLKCKINNSVFQCKSNKWMDDILADRESVVKVVAGICKRHPVAKRKLLSFVL